MASCLRHVNITCLVSGALAQSMKTLLHNSTYSQPLHLYDYYPMLLHADKENPRIHSASILPSGDISNTDPFRAGRS